jgi:hypothetical protein
MIHTPIPIFLLAMSNSLKGTSGQIKLGPREVDRPRLGDTSL